MVLTLPSPSVSVPCSVNKILYTVNVFRYNVAQLEQWSRDKKIQDDKSHVIDSFLPIIQACQLLQVCNNYLNFTLSG
jgi:hypothetical protein